MMNDPLKLLTLIIGLALLGVIGRYVATGQVDKEILAGVTGLFGTLVTALATRAKSAPKEVETNAASGSE